MTIFYGYLAVEGPHDLDFTGKILRRQGLKFVDNKKDVDPFWHKLIPTQYPHNGELGKPVPVPAFYQSPTHSIAISRAGSDSLIVKDINESLSVVDGSKIDSIGALADADSSPAREQFDSIAGGLTKIGLTLPSNPGEIAIGTPRLGVYILPDNSKQGTLEDVLLQAGHEAYQKLHMWAAKAVTMAPVSALKRKEQKYFKKPAGRKKAQLALMANILRPGMAIQNSFRQDNWITEASVRFPLIAPYRKFLIELFQLKTED